MPSDNRPTSQILADDKSLSSILRVGVDPGADLNVHPADGASDGDSFYIVSYLQNAHGQTSTVLFHLIVLNRPSPPAPLALLAISVLDESANTPMYFSTEFADPGQTRTQATRGSLEIRMLDAQSACVGHLKGTMDDLTVEGHAKDNSGKPALDFVLRMKAYGPSFNYLASGIIPFPGGKDYEYAFPRMDTAGTLTVNGNKCDVTGTSWLDREWGHLGPSQWTWISIDLDGFTIGLWDEQPYNPQPNSHVGGQAFATILDTDGAITVTTITIQETSLWKSPDGKRQYASSWLVSIPGWAVLNVRTLKDGQEIISNVIPRLEAKCSVDGMFNGRPVSSSRAFVEVGNIPG